MFNIMFNHQFFNFRFSSSFLLPQSLIYVSVCVCMCVCVCIFSLFSLQNAPKTSECLRLSVFSLFSLESLSICILVSLYFLFILSLCSLYSLSKTHRRLQRVCDFGFLSVFSLPPVQRAAGKRVLLWL